MPPKRAAATAAGGARKSRKSGEGTDTSASAASASASEPAPVVPRSKRWAPVSASANADDEYRSMLQNPVKAFEYVLMCQAPFPLGGEDDDDDDDDEDDDEEEGEDEEKATAAGAAGGGKVKCDGGVTCLCDKPLSEHPDHLWKLTAAGKRKFFTMQTMCDLRTPDFYGMYTFNDHGCYGVIEVVQNIFLDFDEAARNHKEQWTLCEALAFFLPTSTAGAMTM